MVDAKILRMSDIRKCPKLSLSPSHYRDDGSCKCDEEKNDGC